jgi:N utilization substance protein B
MSTRRQVRELALQALYQIDARGEEDMDQIELSVEDAPLPQEVRTEAMEMARAAWAVRSPCDALATELAPEWPTHRQPPIDRSLLRLAYYEIASGVTPIPVAINEAVELAKLYGTEKTPAFINGVLDRIARKIKDAAAPVPPADEPHAPLALSTGDPWLDDALQKTRPTP